jgi:ankyrin repeat protein
LHVAAHRGYEDVVEVLLETDSTNITAVDDLGRTALHLAVMNGHGNVAQLLFEYGPDPQTKDRSGQTSPMLAYERGLSVSRTLP